MRCFLRLLKKESCCWVCIIRGRRSCEHYFSLDFLFSIYNTDFIPKIILCTSMQIIVKFDRSIFGNGRGYVL